MRRFFVAIMTMMLVVRGVAKEDAFAKVDIYQLIDHAEQFRLFSVDPTDPDSLPAEKKKASVETFHGYLVLGQLAADSPMIKDRVRAALTAALTDLDPGPPAMCFEPRVGVRLMSGGRQLDILLCFQCLTSAFYLDGSELHGPLASKGEAHFTALLDEHGIARDVPKEPKKRANQIPQPAPGGVADR
jgi:hypothetical protein